MNYKRVLSILLLLFCFTPWCDSYLAIGLGILIGLLSFPEIHPKMKSWSSDGLKYSIILLGFTIPLQTALQASTLGLWYSSLSVFVTLLIGILLMFIVKVKGKSPLLINIGTAICGASAIASTSTIIKSNEEETGIALVLILILNSIAVFIFPMLGHHFQLSDLQFGVWSAIAIHDTSSVSSACAQFSDASMNIGITIKLIRTLWLIPISFILYFYFKNNNHKIVFPWFVLFFFLAILSSLIIPLPKEIIDGIKYFAKHLFYAAIFIMGTGMTIARFKLIELKMFLFSVLLWTSIVLINLFFIVKIF